MGKRKTTGVPDSEVAPASAGQSLVTARETLSQGQREALIVFAGNLRKAVELCKYGMPTPEAANHIFTTMLNGREFGIGRVIDLFRVENTNSQSVVRGSGYFVEQCTPYLLQLAGRLSLGSNGFKNAFPDLLDGGTLQGRVAESIRRLSRLATAIESEAGFELSPSTGTGESREGESTKRKTLRKNALRDALLVQLKHDKGLTPADIRDESNKPEALKHHRGKPFNLAAVDNGRDNVKKMIAAEEQRQQKDRRREAWEAKGLTESEIRQRFVDEAKLEVTARLESTSPRKKS